MVEQEQEDFGLYDQKLDKDSCGVGLLTNISGEKTQQLVSDALTMLENMEHRGACGFESNSGDGAGILIQIPDKLFRKEAELNKKHLPPSGNYGVAMLFLPKDKSKRQFCLNGLEQACEENNFEILFQRSVGVDNSMIGESPLATEPLMQQVFLSPKKEGLFYDIEKKLYFLKTEILKSIYFTDSSIVDEFYIASLSSKTIVYKGQLKATQLRDYFIDLNDEALESAVAIVHSRFSTNTVPKWKLAQPFRCIAHNGEINTIKGNLNWWKARENFMHKSEIYKEDWVRALPVCDPFLSDSGNFDNVVDFLIRTTRSIPHALMMLIPEAWQNDEEMAAYKKGFYQYHDGIVEPWDGPAGICFTDGNLVGATLDRNGLRPLRYVQTIDGQLMVASEEGCLKIDQSKIIKKGRLRPGKMLLADLQEKRIISDSEIKEVICQRFPYASWLKANAIDLKEIESDNNEVAKSEFNLRQRQISYGMGAEDVNLILKAMVQHSKEPIGSMGADIPLAIFSKLAQHISNYFKQQFAQVTNPPIDSLRENYFMSLSTVLGDSSRVLNINEAQAFVIRMESPMLTPGLFYGLQSLNNLKFRAATVSSCYTKGQSLKEAILDFNQKVKHQIEKGANLICISDRGINEHMTAIPSLMAVGALHHFLIEQGERNQVSLIVETGDSWEVHHFACLLSYGADAIYPYLAIETIKTMKSDVGSGFQNGGVGGSSSLGAGAEQIDIAETQLKNYLKAAEKGLLKVMSKLGVSTLQSYKGAQTFEAIGISSEVIDLCFKGTTSKIEGMNFEQLQREQNAKHQLAFGSKSNELPNKGVYQWKRDAEYHLFNPKSIHLLQHSTKTNDFNLYKKFTEEIDRSENNVSTLRSFIRFKKAKSIPLEEVESVENILKRFASGAMSFGSISHEAHTTLAKAMNRIGAKSNSGEGGEDERRFKKLENGDWERSAIKQVASGRFGVTINYLTNAAEIQIKMAQGAKPGEGGQLPGHKVDENIATVRHATPGVGLISPPPHHDIYSIEDLAQLIFDLKNANRAARISVKLVSKTGVGVIASGVTKAHADHILISGHDGGTGASPLSSISHTGLPWELGLAETHHTLVKNNLRDRVTLQCDGQIRTGRDMAIATLLGAEEWGVATAALVVEGCILMRKCHLNTCPVGIATQDKDLRKKFDGKVEHLVNYFHFLAEDFRMIMADLGFRTVNEMVGRADLLKPDMEEKHWKASNVDLSKLLFYAKPKEGYFSYKVKEQDHGLDKVLDHTLIAKSALAIEEARKFKSKINIQNTDRAVGAMLSNEIAKVYGSAGMKKDSICFRFKGTAGQSFGAFLIKGVSFTLVGASNDYFGKGLSGGRLVAIPNRKVIFNPARNTIVGNVCLYGATSGQAFIKGVAGDRFAVRNSGVEAVVEGVGDNACEYMTGGVVIVLGTYGKNFGAGMSGGIAYVYQEDKDRSYRINKEMVELEECTANDLEKIRILLRAHFNYTSSNLALDILNEWYDLSKHFLKVMPTEYKKALLRESLISATLPV
jgi:glutamate synthase (NADPH/NADH) large chain